MDMEKVKLQIKVESLENTLAVERFGMPVSEVWLTAEMSVDEVLERINSFLQNPKANKIEQGTVNEVNTTQEDFNPSTTFTARPDNFYPYTGYADETTQDQLEENHSKRSRMTKQEKEALDLARGYVDSGNPINQAHYDILSKAAKPRKKDLKAMQEYERSFNKSFDPSSGISDNKIETMQESYNDVQDLNNEVGTFNTKGVNNLYAEQTRTEKPYLDERNYSISPDASINTPGIPTIPTKSCLDLAKEEGKPFAMANTVYPYLPNPFTSFTELREYCKINIARLNNHFPKEVARFSRHILEAANNYNPCPIDTIPDNMLNELYKFIESMPKDAPSMAFAFRGLEVNYSYFLPQFGQFSFDDPDIYKPTVIYIV